MAEAAVARATEALAPGATAAYDSAVEALRTAGASRYRCHRRGVSLFVVQAECESDEALVVEKLLYRGVARGVELKRGAEVASLVDLLIARAEARGGVSGGCSYALATLVAGACVNGARCAAVLGRSDEAGAEVVRRFKVCAAWIGTMMETSAARRRPSLGPLDPNVADARPPAKKAEVDPRRYVDQLRWCVAKAAQQLEETEGASAADHDVAFECRAVAALALATLTRDAREAALELRRAAASHVKHAKKTLDGSRASAESKRVIRQAFDDLEAAIEDLAVMDAVAYAEFGLRHAALAGDPDAVRARYAERLERAPSSSADDDDDDPKRAVALGCVWAARVDSASSDEEALRRTLDCFQGVDGCPEDVERAWRALSRVATLTPPDDDDGHHRGGGEENNNNKKKKKKTLLWEAALRRLGAFASATARCRPALRTAAVGSAVDASSRAAALAARKLTGPSSSSSSCEEADDARLRLAAHAEDARRAAWSVDDDGPTATRICVALGSTAKVLRIAGLATDAVATLRRAAEILAPHAALKERRLAVVVALVDAQLADPAATDDERRRALAEALHLADAVGNRAAALQVARRAVHVDDLPALLRALLENEAPAQDSAESRPSDGLVFSTTPLLRDAAREMIAAAEASKRKTAAEVMALHDLLADLERSTRDEGRATSLLNAADSARRLAAKTARSSSSNRREDDGNNNDDDEETALMDRAKRDARDATALCSSLLLLLLPGDDEERRDAAAAAAPALERIAGQARTLLATLEPERQPEHRAAALAHFSALRGLLTLSSSSSSSLRDPVDAARIVAAVAQLRDAAGARSELEAEATASRLLADLFGNEDAVARRVGHAATALAYATAGLPRLADAYLEEKNDDPPVDDMEDHPRSDAEVHLDLLVRAYLALEREDAAAPRDDDDAAVLVDACAKSSVFGTWGATRCALMQAHARWRVEGSAVRATAAVNDVVAALSHATTTTPTTGTKNNGSRRHPRDHVSRAVLSAMGEGRAASVASRSRARADALLLKAELWFLKGDASRTLLYTAKARDVARDLLIGESASWPACDLLDAAVRAAERRRGDEDGDSGPPDDEMSDAPKNEEDGDSLRRRVDALLVRGDVQRSRGEVDGALAAYAAAQTAVGGFEAAVRTFEPRAAGVQGPLYSRQALGIARRIARCLELKGERGAAEALLRGALAAPRGATAMDRAAATYRLGRLTLHRGDAPVEAVTLLRNSLRLARSLEATKLARHAARALAVGMMATRRGGGDDDDDHLIALLIHSSIGGTQRLLAVSDHGGAMTLETENGSDTPPPPPPPLVAVIRGLDDLLDAALGDERKARPATATALVDEGFEWVVCGACVSPTGHLLVSRLEANRAALNFSRALPDETWWAGRRGSDKGDHRGDEATTAVGRILRTLDRSSTMLRAAEQHGQNTAKEDWWAARRALDSDLETGLADFDRDWLGPLRHAFAPRPDDPAAHLRVEARARELARASGAPVELAALCVLCGPRATDGDLRALLEAGGMRDDPELVLQHLRRSAPKPAASSSRATLQAEVDRAEEAVAEVPKLKVADLKAALGDLGLSKVGLKAVLTERLLSARAGAVADADAKKKAALADDGPTTATVEGSDEDESTAAPPEPLIVALDETLQRLPFEACGPVLRSVGVSRVPSLCFAVGAWRAAQRTTGAALLLPPPPPPPSPVADSSAEEEDSSNKAAARKDAMSTMMIRLRYVVDPEANLGATREAIAPFLLDECRGTCDAEGCVGVAPEEAWLDASLKARALYVYCGHGAGERYLRSGHGRGNVGAYQAAAILMGCSSGKLRSRGDFEPRGIATDLLMGGCPSVVANLWDVTDRDIDKLTLHLLRAWTQDPQASAAHLLPSARAACKLLHINGAAPVCYGIPLPLTQVLGGQPPPPPPPQTPRRSKHGSEFADADDSD